MSDTDTAATTETEEDNAAAGDDIRTVADAKFTRDVEELIRGAEETRLRYMQQNQSRNMVALSVGLAAIFFGGAGFGWFFLMQADLLKALGCILLSAAIPALLFRWARQPLQTYSANYKKEFMPKMAKVMGNLKFHPARGISAKLLPSTGIVPSHDSYHAEDCFMGLYKGFKIIFSEAQLHNKKRLTFDGIFVLLEIPGGDFKGHTIITADPDAARRWGTTRWKDLQKSEPANPDFVTQFTIFSNAQQDADNIASDSLLKEMLETCVLFDNSPLSAAFFKKKYVFMAIPYDVDMFEPSNINIPVTTQDHAMKCKNEVEQILSIIDILELYQKNAAAES